MRKILTGIVAAAMLAVSGSVALADDYVADPRDRSDGNGRCQEVGDPNAGDNDDTGLQTAVDTLVSVIEPEDDQECDNSGGRRPTSED
jgi:hypothetical protein